MWRRDESYDTLIKSAWGDENTAISLGQLGTRLRQVQGALQVWDRETYGSVRKRLVSIRKQLEEERGRAASSGPSRKER